MSIAPAKLARTLRAATARRSLPQPPSLITSAPGTASFLVHDHAGGILQITVSQYKEAIG